MKPTQVQASLSNNKYSPNSERTNGWNWPRLAWATLGMYAWASVLTGVLLPEISAEFDLNALWGGLLLSAPAIGFITAGFIGSYLVTHINLPRLLTISSLILGSGLAFATLAPSHPILFIAVMWIGFSGGLVEIGSNGLIAEMFVDRAAQELNRLHIFFGIGAFLSPLAVAVMVKQGNVWRTPYALATLMTLILTITLAASIKPPLKNTVYLNPSMLLKMSRQPSMLLAWIGAFLFVSSELGFAHWAVTYLNQKPNFPSGMASICVSVFWLAMLLGRYLNTLYSTTLRHRTVIVAESIGGALALYLVLHAQSITVILAGMAFVGLAMAGLLPWLLAFANEQNPGHSGMTSGFILTGVGMGMLLGPGLVGVTADALSLPLAMNLTTIFLFSLAGLFFFFTR